MKNKSNNSKEEAAQKRFRIALSFPGEHRVLVQQVAGYLAEKFNKTSILYDKYFEAEFARPDLDIYLQNLYHKESELIVVFLCADYADKSWCGLEWRAIRDLIKNRKTSSIMPFRFDMTQISGLFSTDGYVWIKDRSAKEIADLILERYQINSNEMSLDSSLATEEKVTQIERSVYQDSVLHEKHIKFQNKIRSKIETELAKDVLKPLRDGFIETIWVEAGKLGDPTIPELINEWFVIDQTSHIANPEIILEKLLRATEFCLEQLEAKGEKISSNHVIWKAAKQILGWLTTLAIRSEELVNSEGENGFDEIDVETLVGVEIYTARKKEHPANFQADTTKDSKENYTGDKLLDLGFSPETGWKAEDVINQIWLIIWKAVGNKERSTPLTPIELKKLDKTLLLHQSRRKNSLNYHFAVRKSATHPLLFADICKQIKTKLPELTIVHIGTESGKGSLLMISEGIIVALIEEFLNLIEQY